MLGSVISKRLEDALVHWLRASRRSLETINEAAGDTRVLIKLVTSTWSHQIKKQNESENDKDSDYEEDKNYEQHAKEERVHCSIMEDAEYELLNDDEDNEDEDEDDEDGKAKDDDDDDNGTPPVPTTTQAIKPPCKFPRDVPSKLTNNVNFYDIGSDERYKHYKV
jgi:hypothetical protein